MEMERFKRFSQPVIMYSAQYSRLLRWTQQQQFETGELFILILYPLFSFKKVAGFSSVRVLLSEKLIPYVRACVRARARGIYQGNIIWMREAIVLLSKG